MAASFNEKNQHNIQRILYSTLTTVKHLKPVRTIYGQSIVYLSRKVAPYTFTGIEHPDGEATAPKSYRNALVPLHYHELWVSIVRDYRSPEIKPEERAITIDNVVVSHEWVIETEQEITVIVGEIRVIFGKFFFFFQLFISVCFIYIQVIHLLT